jgi:hypothetical protein
VLTFFVKKFQIFETQTGQYSSAIWRSFPSWPNRIEANKFSGPLREELGSGHDFDFVDGEYEAGPAPGKPVPMRFLELAL